MLRRLIGYILQTLFIAIICLICAILLLFIAARYLPQPLVFFGVGVTGFVVMLYALTMARQRWFHKRQRSSELKIKHIYAVNGLLLLIIIVSLVRPLNDNSAEMLPVPGQSYWQLPNALDIAYVHLYASNSLQKPPIIFLHGGPGVPDMLNDAAYLQPLVEEGYHVYVYDQIGSGSSSRLKDPGEYTISRDVAELEWIRQHIDAEKIILIGHSYGGIIAAHYLAAYDHYVDKVIFLSPGPIDPNDRSGGNLANRLTSAEKRPLYKAMLHPRVLMTYALLQVNPMAAINYVGDEEMDARFDRVYSYTQPALHARGLPLGPAIEGLGFYANQTPQSATAMAYPDIRPQLMGKEIPSLTIKGSSDYLSWSSAAELKRLLPISAMVYLQRAGHNTYQDQPAQVMEILKAFLEQTPLPVEPYDGYEMPPDYEGLP